MRTENTNLKELYKNLWITQERQNDKQNKERFYLNLLFKNNNTENDNISRTEQHNFKELGLNSNLLIVDSKTIALQDLRFNKPIKAIGKTTIAEKKLLNRILKAKQHK